MSETLFYKRATFVAHLPKGHRYTASHAWMAPAPHSPGSWCVGLTKFAYRMLGELVEVRLESPLHHPVRIGEIVGSIEGFKAISDLYNVVDGLFEGLNPALAQGPEPLANDVHHTWIFQVRGQPDPRSMDVIAYSGVLDATIDRLLEKQGGAPAPDPDPDVPA